MRISACVFLFAAAVSLVPSAVFTQSATSETCPRGAAGSVVSDPENLRSDNGVLKVSLTFKSYVSRAGETRYCYIYEKDGAQAPTLRLKPGDTLILSLKNSLIQSSKKLKASQLPLASPEGMRMSITSPCANATMSSVSANLHFHGIAVPAACHEDDVLKTVIDPGDPPFEYRFQIPADEPPGLYWYHPHIHGISKSQVVGGASGALIVEGIERANSELAGLPERVVVIRDQELVNPNARPASSSAVPPMTLRDAEGDILNTGTGTGKPAMDLSVNFIPVPYPDYRPAIIETKPDARQFWRVLNASALTYLDLQILVGNQQQQLGVVSLDGVPINENGAAPNKILWQSHIAIPPAGRAEFILKGLPEGTKATVVTRSVDTGPLGENDPTRPLATILATSAAPNPQSSLAASPTALEPSREPWLGNVIPIRQRKLYFSEQPRDPKDPKSPTDFFITVDGETPRVFDMHSTSPNIVVHQGDVEDWIIENRSQELHAFHVHQIRFMLVQWTGVPVDEPYLRDTINVPYWDGSSPQFPSVKLRMDFRDPNAIGTLVFHCHLLDHEDGGMMGTVRVDPPLAPQNQK